MTTSVPAYIPAFSALVNALNFNMVGIYKGIDSKLNNRAEVRLTIMKKLVFRDEIGKFRPKPKPAIPSHSTKGNF